MIRAMYGAFIRRVREARGMTQETLAAVAGISQPNLSAYERDRRVPTGATLNRIVVACGFQLAATDGEQTIFCPLPAVGWFPGDGDPEREGGDPAGDHPPIVDAETPMVDRASLLLEVLALAEATS